MAPTPDTFRCVCSKDSREQAAVGGGGWRVINKWLWNILPSTVRKTSAAAEGALR
jgi:hypothetical protein